MPFGGRRFGGRRSGDSFRGGSGGSFRDGPRRDFGAPRDAPVKVGEEHDVEITEVGSKGDGIARVKNFVVFVPNTQKGDKVRIRIVEIRGRSAIGKVVGEGESSEDKETTESSESEETEETSGDEESEDI